MDVQLQFRLTDWLFDFQCHIWCCNHAQRLCYLPISYFDCQWTPLFGVLCHHEGTLIQICLFFHELNIPHSLGRMGTSPEHSDFWIVWGGQAFVMIGRWYSRQPLTNFKSNACPPSRSQKLLRRKLVPIPPMDNYELPYKILFSPQLTISFHNNVPVIFCFV